MNENTNTLTPIEIKEFSDVFENTILEISIFDSLYGRNAINDYVKKALRSSIDDLHNFGMLKTLATKIDENEPKREGKKQTEELQKNKRELYQRYLNEVPQLHSMLDYELLKKKIDLLKQKEEKMDFLIEKCTEDGERTMIRRETENNYVNKWEKARVENFKFQFKAEELELQKKITELQAKLETEKNVDLENETFLNYTIDELEKQNEYWEFKYKIDVKEIDEKIENLMETLKKKSIEIESLKEICNEKQAIIEEHAKNKEKLEEEKKINDYKEKMITKIQAWWRGTMVRHHLGPYKHLLGPRKKSIKKPLIHKGKKTKNK